MLCRRIDNDIGAKLQRVLGNRGGEYIVDDDLRARRMRHLGDSLDIDKVQHRVGGRFEEHQLCWRRQRGAPLVEIGAIDKFGGDAPAWQDVMKNGIAGAEQGAAGDDPVAGVQLARQCGKDTGHTGAGGEASFRPFKRGQPVLKHGHCRVAIARIDIAVGLTGKGGGGFLGAVIDIAGIQKQRFACFLEFSSFKPATNKFCVAAVFVSHPRGLHRQSWCLAGSRPGRNSARHC